MQGIAVSETEKEVNAFPATPVTVLINIGACSIDYYRLTKIPWRKPRDPLEIFAEKRGRGKMTLMSGVGVLLILAAVVILNVSNGNSRHGR